MIRLMSKRVTGNVLSHNSTSDGTLEELLQEQRATNEILSQLLCSMQQLVKHLELMTDTEVEIDD
jgi:hypothetical protein